MIQRPYEKGKRREYYLDHLRRYDDAVRDSLDAGAPEYRTLRTGRTVYGAAASVPMSWSKPILRDSRFTTPI
ncbi:MAG: hypothetical protein ACLRM8_09705 [Alistipes sp.]